MTAIERNEQKPGAVRDAERLANRPAPGSQPPRSGHDEPPSAGRDKAPSDGEAIAELGDELGGPA